jgi:UPF0716 protein FxsA
MMVGMKKLLKYTIIVLPFAELLTAYGVGVYVGFWGVLLLLLASTLWGMWVLRVKGALKLRQLYQQLATGQAENAQSMAILLLLLAGFMLFIPGLISGLFGAVLMLPLVRENIIKYMDRKGIFNHPNKRPKAKSNVIEGEFWRDK